MKCADCGSKNTDVTSEGGINYAVCMDCGHDWRTEVDHLDTRTKVDVVTSRCEYQIPEELVRALKTNSDLTELGWDLKLSDQAQQSELMSEYNGDQVLEFGPIKLSDNSPFLINSYLCNEWGIPKGHQLLCGDGHTWVALDYTVASDNPSVCFIATGPFRKVVLYDDVRQMLAAQQVI